jgi:hypothetical protein
MLTFLATCSKCGGELGAAAEKRNGDPIYRCNAGCSQIREEWLDEYVSLTAIERLSRPDAYQAGGKPGKEAAAARAEAAELRARLEEHADLAADGKISPLSFARIEQKLLEKIAAADRRAEIAAVPPVFREIAGPYEQVAQKWEQLPVTARKELCRALFEEISVSPRVKHRRPKRHRGKFEVRLTIDGRERYFGAYATMEEAIEARNAKYAELGIKVTDDDASTPGWDAFDPERVSVKLREGLHAAT